MNVTRQDGRRERGAVIIWSALFLVFLLGFVALGIDVSKLMATRTQLQNAADAAALAGASAINFTTGVVDPDTALVRAMATASANRAFVNTPEPIMLLAADVVFPATNQVQVTVRRDAASGGSMVTHIAQVLGITSLDVKATAVAKAESVSSVCEKIVPMGATFPPGGPFLTGCANTYNLKVGAHANQQGNFQLLDFPNCDEGPCAGIQGGGAEIRCEVAQGYSCCISIGQMVPTMPGNKVGPFGQGLSDRWSRDNDQRENICYENYTGNGQRIVIVPIVDSFDVNGKKPVKVIGFSAFFLQSKPSGGGQQTLKGQFLHQVVPGTGGPGAQGNALFALRLIQ